MAKDPAFLFYVNDFDCEIKFFTHEQVGIFIRLLIAQHQHGHLTKEQMIFIAGIEDDAVFAKFSKDKKGRFFNVWLDERIEQRKKFCESRKKSRLCAIEKGKHSQPIDNQVPVTKKENNVRQTHVLNTENENENIFSNNNLVDYLDNKIAKNSLEQMFIQFYKLYPKKISVKRAREKFFKIKPDEKLFEKMITALERQKLSAQWQKDNGQFIPHPATWLNQERWNDEDTFDQKAKQDRVAEKIAKLEKMLGRPYDPQIDGNVTPD